MTTKPSFLSKLGIGRKAALESMAVSDAQINPSTALNYGLTQATIASLMQGTGKKGVRSREQIYQKLAQMEGDAIVSTAIQLLVTAALGGHETTGDLVFIEPTMKAQEDEQLKTLVADIGDEISHLLNRNAFATAFTAAIYGDAYCRVYTKEGEGLVDIYSDELVRPILVQPFERGSKTIGYGVYAGEKSFERLDTTQMVRFRMPRTQWQPQYGIMEKSLRSSIREDDVDRLPIMPAAVGGSLLSNAEEAFDNLSAALAGLVGQRWIDSIDEQFVMPNLDGMTNEQQLAFTSGIKRTLQASADRVSNAVKNNRPIMERIRHIIPVFGEKQITTMTTTNGQGRASNIQIDDVMLHARMMSGALGVDLSMIGFADQMSGGLGEGGFFRTSAQAAERARVIRVAMAEGFNSLIDLHTLSKYGMVFAPKDRPWRVNFYGSISALESEKQRTKMDAMNAGQLMVQAMQSFKDMGATQDMMHIFLSKSMMVDEEIAKIYAEIVNIKAPELNDDGLE